MTLIDRMTKVYDRVYPISDRLGVKQHVDFSYKSRTSAINEPPTVVTPRPKMGNPPPNKLYEWLNQGVEVNDGDRYIIGISRTFEGIRQGAVCIIDGAVYTILWIDNSQSVTYNLLVRPERAR